METTEKCPICGKPYHSHGGRSLRITDEQIAGILTHSRAEQPKHTIKHFCELLGISPYTYNLITRMRLKKLKDIERVVRIGEELNNERSQQNV
jgi:hypothetical protein